MSFDFIKSALMWFGGISFAIFVLGMGAMYSAGEFEKMMKNYRYKKAIKKAKLLPKCPVEWRFIESTFSNGERIDAEFTIGNNRILGKLIIGTKNNGLWDITAFEFCGINSDHGFEPKLKTDMYDLYKGLNELVDYFDSNGVKFVENSMKFWHRLENEVKKINNLQLVERKIEEKQ